MKTWLALVAGVAIGAIAVATGNAQMGAKKVFMISESQIVNKDKIDSYQAKLFPAIKAAGGTIHISDKVTQLLGDPPQRVGVTEFESVDKAMAWFKSKEREGLAPERDPAIKLIRQYVIETK